MKKRRVPAVIDPLERRLLLSATAMSLANRSQQPDGTISGRVFDDLNSNGIRESTEPPLAGWTVFIDLNHDGTLDPGDPVATTTGSGRYSLKDVPAGDWTLRLIIPEGWRATGNSALTGQVVELQQGQSVRGVDFGAVHLPPTVTSANFDYTMQQPVLTFSFDEPVSFPSIGNAVTVYNLATQEAVSPVDYSYKPGSDTLTVTFGAPLPEGNYAAVLSQGQITDAAGQHLGGDPDGTGGDDFVFNFFSLIGDVNHDGTVDNTDLQIVLANLGRHGTYAMGNIDGGHKIDLQDVQIVESNLGHTVFPDPTSYTFVDLTPQGFTDFSPGGVGGGQATGAGTGPATGNQYHAELFSASGAVTDLNPSTFDGSFSFGLFGNQQVGSGIVPNTANKHHALLWNGNAGSAMDLNPAGSSFSEALGIFADQQVGYADSASSLLDHAKLWYGSSSSVVDLNPPGYTDSFANATSGDAQVGTGTISSKQVALLWHGTAASAVNLNPTGYSQSEAKGVWAREQVGDAYLGSSFHALLWHGTAASAVDLNPAGFLDSEATGTDGRFQVGLAMTSGFVSHAMRWNGSAASALDLQQFVPAAFTNSVATAIGANGVILGVAYANDSQRHLVEWIPKA